MNNRYLRAIVLFITAGLVWHVLLRAVFVWSGAQGILANPQYQHSKFINAFVGNPPARMAVDSSIAWKGLIVVGWFMAAAFLIINSRLAGGWFKRGLLFGLLQWLIMVPWFEFYLPYNVMLEPLSLVLLEGGLWFVLAICLALYMSFVINFKND